MLDLNTVNNIGATLDLYYKKHRYKKQDTVKEESEEQISLQEEPDVVLSVNSDKQSLFGGTQPEMENETSKMIKNLEPATGLDAEAIVVAAKQQILDTLIKSARMLLSVRYTSRTWERLIEALKMAMPIAGSDKAVMLDKAISIMQGSLAGMELANPDQDDNGVREQLPTDQSINGTAPVAVNTVNISV